MIEEIFLIIFFGFLLAFTITASINIAVSYAAGRRAGGYPLFARFRKRFDPAKSAYEFGRKQGSKRIARGGYR